MLQDYVGVRPQLGPAPFWWYVVSVPDHLKSNQILLLIEPRDNQPEAPEQLAREVAGMHSLQRRQEYCQSRGQIFRMASALTGRPASELLISKDSWGKPYLEGFPQFRLNISHSSEFVASSISLEQKVGIDIETIARFSYSIGAKERRWLHPEEAEQLQSRTQPELPFELCRLWTMKEAYAKSQGLGLGIRFRELLMTPPGPELKIMTQKHGNSVLSICSATSLELVMPKIVRPLNVEKSSSIETAQHSPRHN